MGRTRVAFTSRQWVDIAVLTVLCAALATMVLTAGMDHHATLTVFGILIWAMLIKVALWLVPLAFKARQP